MSFKSRDLMVDVLPAKNPFVPAGLVLCGQITADGIQPGPCVDATANPAPGPCVDATANPAPGPCVDATANPAPGPCVDVTAGPEQFARPNLGLALLRQQLREALSTEQAARS